MMTRRYQETLRQLVGEIVAGQLRTGDILNEEDVAERGQFSRGTARECIQALEHSGVVTVTHGKGARIADIDNWDLSDPELLQACLEGPRREQLIGELLELQRVLAVMTARLGAERATVPIVVRLSGLVQDMTDAAQRAQSGQRARELFAQAEIGFHELLLTATGNAALTRASQPTWRALPVTWSMAASKRQFDRRVTEYRRILAAVSDRGIDEAGEAMNDYVTATEQDLLDRQPPTKAPMAPV
jgi:DNA-binding FadR family transcriptional regulator